MHDTREHAQTQGLQSLIQAAYNGIAGIRMFYSCENVRVDHINGSGQIYRKPRGT